VLYPASSPVKARGFWMLGFWVLIIMGMAMVHIQLGSSEFGGEECGFDGGTLVIQVPYQLRWSGLQQATHVIPH